MRRFFLASSVAFFNLFAESSAESMKTSFGGEQDICCQASGLHVLPRFYLNPAPMHRCSYTELSPSPKKFT